MKLFFSKKNDVYEFGVGFNKPVVLALIIVGIVTGFRIAYHANPMWRIDEDEKEATDEQHHDLILAIFNAKSIKKSKTFT